MYPAFSCILPRPTLLKKPQYSTGTLIAVHKHRMNRLLQNAELQLSYTATTVFSNSITCKCCGHTCSHWPHCRILPYNGHRSRNYPNSSACSSRSYRQTAGESGYSGDIPPHSTGTQCRESDPVVLGYPALGQLPPTHTPSEAGSLS